MSSIPKAALLARSAAVLGRLVFWAPGSVRRFRQERARAGGGAGRDAKRSRALFYYSQVVWQDVWQRPQEMALGLSEYLPVIFMSPLQVHRVYDSVRDWRREIRIDRGRGIRVIQPLILPGEYKSRRIFDMNQRLIWAEACAVLPPDAEIVFLSNSPFSATLLDRFRWAKKVYDLIDDFPGFSWAPPQSRALEEKWLRAADVVLTGTHALSEKHRSIRPDITFIPSGVRFDRFHAAPTEPPEELARLPRPILGFIGTVSDRLDRQLLEALSREFAEGSIVLIGPVHGSFDAPRHCPNLHLLGPRPHERLPAYVRQFDLALLPFAINEATQATNPTKTLEYLAAGRIVLSTAIPDVIRFFSNEVLIARDREEFIRLARHWLAADSEALRARGVERARQSSWEETIGRVARRLELIPGMET